MKIIPIGIYGLYPLAGKATCCYIVDSGNEKAVVDFGSGALSLLQMHIKPQDVSAFIITSLRYDHCADVLPLSCVSGKHTVYAPCAPSETFSLIKAQKNIDTRVINSALRFSVGSMEFEFARCMNAERYAVRVTEGSNSFVYAPVAEITNGLAAFCRGATIALADCSDDCEHGTVKSDGDASLRIIAVNIHPNTCGRKLNTAGIGIIEEGKTIDLW